MLVGEVKSIPFACFPRHDFVRRIKLNLLRQFTNHALIPACFGVDDFCQITTRVSLYRHVVYSH